MNITREEMKKAKKELLGLYQSEEEVNDEKEKIIKKIDEMIRNINEKDEEYIDYE